MRIATRSSPLATWQARAVATALEAVGSAQGDIELVPVRTTGDVDVSTPISEMSGRGVFVTEVQAAVLDGRADIAVHSAKDMRSEPTPGLTLAGCLVRGDARDALVGLALDAIPRGGVVATGSQRRQCQLAALRGDLRFTGLRGNMARRIAAAAQPDVDAVIVAAAALERLGESHRIAQRFGPDEIVPQVGQGAIAIEHRTGDADAAAAAGAIIDEVTTRCVHAERAFLRTLGAGCDLPTGAHAVIDAGGSIAMTAVLATANRDSVMRASGLHLDGESLGVALANELLARVDSAEPRA
ncbi:hydroxymethylbilane synthase [Candidatus Poriferisodalis sp.]|uniref:hydroxymethylbilane synthase n=1 Tax=Candidatus Poriferisodalis sp. TaxID=3101277 RepID=UPI003B5B2AC3